MVTLVPVDSAAADLLAALHALCFADSWRSADFVELLQSPGVAALIAVADGAPVGLILGRVVLDEAEVLTVGVVPAQRRQGLGRVLMEALSRLAVARGAMRLFLEVSEINRAAAALYLDLGFVETGRRRGYYADGSSALTMMRLLVPG